MEKRFFNSLFGASRRAEIFIAHIYRRNAKREEEKKPGDAMLKKKFHYEFHSTVRGGRKIF
jgi:hypothetical protein